jgi:hypothetical protein
MACNIRQHISRAATVALFDESHGVFCELIDPEVVLSALKYEDNVGKLDDPAAARQITVLHSLSCQDQSEMVVEFDNITNYPICVRWMDEHGQSNPFSHQWTIDSQQTLVRLTQPGHVFIISVVIDQEEFLIGAYRALKTLPSDSPHLVAIEEQSSDDETSSFFFEMVLTDETKNDALTATAASLDPIARGGYVKPKTISTLSTIVDNILCHPNDIQFQTLRLSNPVVQHHIASSAGAMHMLHVLNFREDDDRQHLTVQQPQLQWFRHAKRLLELLHARSEPNLVAEMAAPVPWQPPTLTSSSLSHWNLSGTHMITPEERWARTERWSSLRGHRGGGRPPPFRGEAPSSRGLWGR